MSHVLVFRAIDRQFNGQWEGSFTIDRKGRKCLVAQVLQSGVDDREFQVETYNSLNDSYVVTTDLSSCQNLQYVENIERALEIIAVDATARCMSHLAKRTMMISSMQNAACFVRSLDACS